ncbi:MAG: aldo/keto reductase [Candidatus Dormibacteria bacterium]
MFRDPCERSPLGKTSVFVDRLILGLTPLGNLYKVISDQDAEGVLQAWWDRGLRTFDVAPVYGYGIAEERLGRFLRDKPRGEFVVSTKVGRPVRRGAAPDPALYWADGTPYYHGTPEGVFPYYDYTREGMLWGLEQSLTRLGLDRVDYVHMHDPDDHVREAVEVVFPVLSELKAQGVIGAIGTGTNWGRVGYAIARECALDCVLLAGKYTLLDFEGQEQLLPYCAEQGISVINGGVFSSGFLTDPKVGATYRYRPTADEGLVARALQIKAICERHGVSLKAAAIQFGLGHPAVTSVVVGAGSAQHATEVIDLFEEPVPDAMWAELLAEGALPAGTPVPQTECSQLLKANLGGRNG